MKKLLLALLLSGTGTTLLAGIYRHDVPRKSYTDLAYQLQFDCAGMVLSPVKEDEDLTGLMLIGPKSHRMIQQGSCVLISERHVLSAAHVFVRYDIRQDTIVQNGRQMIVNMPLRPRAGNAADYYFRFKGRDYKATDIRIFPGYLDTASEAKFDLALITLAEPVKDIVPVPLGMLTDELHARVVGVGFGASGVADKPETVTAKGEKIAGENIIDSLTGPIYRGQPCLMKCDFDHPVRTTECNKTGSGEPLPLEYITTGGDSGCGLFRQRNGSWELTGILSGGGTNIDQLLKTGYYGQTMLFIRVALFREWILKQM